MCAFLRMVFVKILIHIVKANSMAVEQKDKPQESNVVCFIWKDVENIRCEASCDTQMIY